MARWSLEDASKLGLLAAGCCVGAVGAFLENRLPASDGLRLMPLISSAHSSPTPFPSAQIFAQLQIYSGRFVGQQASPVVRSTP